MKPQTVANRILRNTTLRPQLGLVLGSGYQSALERLTVECELPFAELPGFPSVSVKGHAGKVVVGKLGGTPVIVLSGRAHYYEGHSLDVVTFPIRVLAAAGVKAVLLTNAAGGIRRGFRVGDFMALSDHINFMGLNPLRGEGWPGCARFVDLTHTYDAGLQALLKRAAKREKVRLHSGIYLAVSGPSYETPAEIRMFARWGADAVGMSTVPEAIVARQCGLTVAGLSCITNLAAGRGEGEVSHAEVLDTGKQVADKTARLLARFAELYGQTTR